MKVRRDVFETALWQKNVLWSWYMSCKERTNVSIGRFSCLGNQGSLLAMNHNACVLFHRFPGLWKLKCSTAQLKASVRTCMQWSIETMFICTAGNQYEQWSQFVSGVVTRCSSREYLPVVVAVGTYLFRIAEALALCREEGNSMWMAFRPAKSHVFEEGDVKRKHPLTYRCICTSHLCYDVEPTEDAKKGKPELPHEEIRRIVHK